MNEITDWLCHYFVQQDPGFATLSQQTQLNENFFTSGRLDSMAIMTLLLDAEAQFGFRFSPEGFQDRRLQTIAGLAEVISEHLAEA